VDGAKVLIIEDEMLVAEGIKDMLVRQGYEVPAIASSMEQALEKAEEVRPHIILMDIRLKGEKDGIDAALIIQNRFDIPVIYLTAYADEATLIRARATMPFGYIVKPVGRDVLHGGIQMALYRHSVETELRSHLRRLEKVVGEEGKHSVPDDLKEALRAINRLREEVVTALATTGEVIGIYPVGHAERVAVLAATTAQQLGFSARETEGIRLMGLLHDIGKALVPRDILSKPAELNPLERELLKTHPKTGYEILKVIEFSFPVAEAVLQHHEKMNGSGYPGGLSGDAIIPEAKVLAVAEAVEPLACHQLFRPGLGNEAALLEITQNKGVLYDSEAVDACLKLFREKGFSFT